MEGREARTAAGTVQAQYQQYLRRQVPQGAEVEEIKAVRSIVAD